MFLNQIMLGFGMISRARFLQASPTRIMTNGMVGHGSDCADCLSCGIAG